MHRKRDILASFPSFFLQQQKKNTLIHLRWSGFTVYPQSLLLFVAGVKGLLLSEPPVYLFVGDTREHQEPRAAA